MVWTYFVYRFAVGVPAASLSARITGTCCDMDVKVARGVNMTDPMQSHLRY